MIPRAQAQLPWQPWALGNVLQPVVVVVVVVVVFFGLGF